MALSSRSLQVWSCVFHWQPHGLATHDIHLKTQRWRSDVLSRLAVEQSKCHFHDERICSGFVFIHSFVRLPKKIANGRAMDAKMLTLSTTFKSILLMASHCNMIYSWKENVKASRCQRLKLKFFKPTQLKPGVRSCHIFGVHTLSELQCTHNRGR